MLAWKQMLFLESRPHMSMKLDRAGMRMWEGLREREARSNPGGYIPRAERRSMKLDRAGMRMWEGLREREARSNPGGYEKILKNTRFFALVVLEYLMKFVRNRTNFATEQE